MKSENKITPVRHYHTTNSVPSLFEANLQQTTTRTTSKHYQNHIETSLEPPQDHHALCSVSLGPQAKFLSQNEVGTSMRRCLRDFYAVGMPAGR